MNGKDKYNNFLENIKVISESNNKAIEAIREASINSLNQISSIYKDIGIKENFANITNAFSSLANTYEDVLSKYRISSTIDIADFSKSMVNILSETQNISTNFTKIIEESIIDSNYNELLENMHKTINSSFISSQDFVFLKASNLVTDASSTINIPNGLITSINHLNKYSADRLIDNNNILYDTSKKQFVDKNNIVASSSPKGMNMICSTMYLFEDFGEYELFTEEELMNFLNILENKRTHAINSDTGRKISSFIKNCVPKIDFDKTIYYHARTRKNNECPYTNAEMLCPPTGIMNPGRYNYPGQSFYYFTNSIDGCRNEMAKHHDDCIIQIAKIKPIKPIVVIDLSGTIAHAKTLLKHIRFERGDNQIPREYYLPCFISDCCRDIGIEGIKYRGSNSYSNYVCWNSGYFEFVEMLETT